jgi:hypothetical protein
MHADYANYPRPWVKLQLSDLEGRIDVENVCKQIQHIIPNAAITSNDSFAAERGRLSQFRAILKQKGKETCLIDQVICKLGNEEKMHGPGKNMAIPLKLGDRLRGSVMRIVVFFEGNCQHSDDQLQKLVTYLNSLDLGHVNTVRYPNFEIWPKAQPDDFRFTLPWVTVGFTVYQGYADAGGGVDVDAVCEYMQGMFPDAAVTNENSFRERRKRLEDSRAKRVREKKDVSSLDLLIDSTHNTEKRWGPGKNMSIPLKSGDRLDGSVSRVAIRFRGKCQHSNRQLEKLASYLDSLGLGEVRMLRGPIPWGKE